jgi:hypothetical protein
VKFRDTIANGPGPPAVKEMGDVAVAENGVASAGDGDVSKSEPKRWLTTDTKLHFPLSHVRKHQLSNQARHLRPIHTGISYDGIMV